MKVFHGSTTTVDAPSVSFGRDNLDFGKGFYVTTLQNIENYMAGQIDKETALGRLKYHLPNNQICILNQSIIEQHLSFIGHETINIE